MAPKRKVSSVVDTAPRDKKQKTSIKDVNIQKFKGMKLPLQCSAATAVHRFKGNLKKWGFYADLRGIYLCFWSADSDPVIVGDSNIIGCLFRNNVDLEDFPEALALLFGSEHDDQSRICICILQDNVDAFDQNAVDQVAVKTGKPPN
ncbi:unnamed protein product [Calypogeia fissa]